jgi:hypothetical protein
MTISQTKRNTFFQTQKDCNIVSNEVNSSREFRKKETNGNLDHTQKKKTVEIS